MSVECTPPKKLFPLYVSLWVASFFSPLLYSGMNNVLPAISTDFNASAATISLIVMLFAFSQGFFGTIGAQMSSLFGLRRMMSIGFLICAGTLIGLFLAPNLMILGFFRFAQGIGTALLINSSIAIAVNITPIHNRGSILGILAGAAYLGGTLGPLIAGIITEFVGWRLLFLTLLIPCLSGLFLFRHSLKYEWCTINGGHFDTVGALLLGAGLGCVALGTGLFSHYFPLVWLIPIGIITLCVFIYTQKRTKSPIINIDLFVKAKSYSLGMSAMFINFGSMSAMIYFIALYFQQVLQFTPIIAGLFLLFRSFPQFTFSPFAGKLADRMHPEYILIVGIFASSMSLIGVAFLDADSSLYYASFILFLAGTGISIFSAPCMLSALRDVQPEDISLASSLMGTGRSMGMLFSQLIISLAVSHYLGPKEVTAETVPLFLDSMQSSLLILASLNLLCLLAYVRFTYKIIKKEKKAKLLEKNTEKTSSN